MRILFQIGVFFTVCLAGEWIASLLPFAFPASMISMLLLFALLFFRVLKPDHLREKTDFLLENMAFFFVPAGVGILAYLDVMKSIWLPFLCICIITTVLTFAAAAYTVRLVLYLQNRKEAQRHE